jgi:L-seryl-tRNA(Ser) seleniumtransferase
MQPRPVRDKQALLRELPKVDRLLADPLLSALAAALGERVLKRLVHTAIEEERQRVLADGEPANAERVRRTVLGLGEALMAQRTRRVINATGVVLHTNLGRAPLAAAAVAALASSAGGYASLEIDLPSGKRGGRGAFAERALAELTGAGAALLVNNNAAAVLLALTCLARGKSVVVSRGELIEIGGGFRIPEVLERSGARLIEVGTTNKTRLEDYARALDAHPDVALLLRVHQANFRQVGFVARPALADLAKLARARGVLLVKDLGGGALVDLRPHGLHGEPTAGDAVAAGAHVVCFSCDKLLGGPQGGALVGDSAVVAALRREPLARALRLSRLGLVALEATLAAYLEGRPLETIPVLRALSRPLAEVERRVDGWCDALVRHGINARRVASNAAVGGGALAAEPVPSAAAALAVADPALLAQRLRSGEPAVVVRIQDDLVVCDARSVLDDEDEALVAALIAASGAQC